jgi:hypothetical protein
MFISEFSAKTFIKIDYLVIKTATLQNTSLLEGFYFK